MTKVSQNITRSPLGKTEARLLAKMGTRLTFSIEEARQVLGHKADDPTRQFFSWSGYNTKAGFNGLKEVNSQ